MVPGRQAELYDLLAFVYPSDNAAKDSLHALCLMPELFLAVPALL